MTGSQYEQFVRASLARRIGVPANSLRSTREPGATLPNQPEVIHQIDLIYVDETEIAKYVTIVECKYRSSSPVDQEEVAKLAFVKGSMKASKAILVTNTEFTRGARAVAEAERIGLLIVRPALTESDESALPRDGGADAIFEAVDGLLSSNRANSEMTVVMKIAPSPGEGGGDLLSALVSNPEVRSTVERVVRDPAVRREVERLASENPDLARSALDILRRRRF